MSLLSDVNWRFKYWWNLRKDMYRLRFDPKPRVSIQNEFELQNPKFESMYDRIDINPQKKRKLLECVGYGGMEDKEWMDAEGIKERDVVNVNKSTLDHIDGLFSGTHSIDFTEEYAKKFDIDTNLVANIVGLYLQDVKFEGMPLDEGGNFREVRCTLFRILGNVWNNPINHSSH